MQGPGLIFKGGAFSCRDNRAGNVQMPRWWEKDRPQPPLSLNKKKRWEKARDLPVVKDFRDVWQIKDIGDTYGGDHYFFPAGWIHSYRTHRPVTAVDPKEHTETWQSEDHVRLPFRRDEFPIGHQARIHHRSAADMCPGCRAHMGRAWQQNGTGKKSKKKTKGMKRQAQRERVYRQIIDE